MKQISGILVGQSVNGVILDFRPMGSDDGCHITGTESAPVHACRDGARGKDCNRPRPSECWGADGGSIGDDPFGVFV